MNIKESWQDVIEGAKNHEFWMTFGLNDIKAKYRRSKLGQWWITLSVAVFIFVIGGLYMGIFNADSRIYMLYLSVGYIVWLLISESLSQGCMVLAHAKPFIMQKDWAASTFVYRLIYRELVVLSHHVVILPPIFIWLGIWPGFGGIALAVLGLLVTVFTLFWIALILAIVTLRYRDIPPIIDSLLRLAFFATPIIWINRNIGTFGDIVVSFNPFTYLIAIIRKPLMNEPVPLSEWLISLGIAFAVMMLALFVLGITKKRLGYWV